MPAPDTIQNIVVAIKLLVLHNYVAIILFVFTVSSAVLSVWKPKRAFILLMIGFCLLLVRFEYQKHIKDALFEQTKNSLITERESARIERLVSIGIRKIAPTFLFFAGGTCVVLGIAMTFQSIQNKRV
jgi:hypothetical protein